MRIVRTESTICLDSVSLCVPVHKFVRGCVNKGYHTNANEGWRVKDHNANRGCQESSESVCVCVCVLHFPKMPCT